MVKYLDDRTKTYITIGYSSSPNEFHIKTDNREFEIWLIRNCYSYYSNIIFCIKVLDFNTEKCKMETEGFNTVWNPFPWNKWYFEDAIKYAEKCISNLYDKFKFSGVTRKDFLARHTYINNV